MAQNVAKYSGHTDTWKATDATDHFTHASIDARGKVFFLEYQPD